MNAEQRAAVRRLQDDLDEARAHSVVRVLLEHLQDHGAAGLDVRAAATFAMDREAEVLDEGVRCPQLLVE